MASYSLALELLAIQTSEKIHQIVAADGFEAEFAFARKFIEFYEVAAIGRHGVGGKPLLHAHVCQE